jgi:hypothetical protein
MAKCRCGGSEYGMLPAMIVDLTAAGRSLGANPTLPFQCADQLASADHKTERAVLRSGSRPNSPPSLGSYLSLRFVGRIYLRLSGADRRTEETTFRPNGVGRMMR